MRFGSDVFRERGDQPGLTDPGLTGQQDELSLARLRLFPPAHQPVAFFVTPDQLRGPSP